MNIFLDGLPDEDFRGWRYDENCRCERCTQFNDAACYIVAKMEGFDVTPP